MTKKYKLFNMFIGQYIDYSDIESLRTAAVNLAKELMDYYNFNAVEVELDKEGNETWTSLQIKDSINISKSNALSNSNNIKI